MAGRKRDGVNRSQFIRDFLSAKPRGSAREANLAWKEAGNSGELGSSLFYQVKGRLGLPSGRGRRGRRRKGAAESKTESQNTTAEVYQHIEAKLDDLIVRAESLKDGRLAADLRAARRRASAKLI